MAEFRLSASLTGHESDVKQVAFPNSKVVISASRDGTVRIWDISSADPNVHEDRISSHSTAYVNSVAYLPPSKDFAEGLVISGGKDTLIDVRQPSKGPEDDAEALLLGHTANICALDVDPAGKFIVSGAWDSEARLWPVGNWESKVVFKGHEHAVWGVLAYNSDTIITVAADQKIRIFRASGKLVKEFQGGSTPIRALCRLPESTEGDFATADNEGIIKLWKLSGQQVAELRGHDSFIYSLACLPTGEIVSAGEDRTVRIWKNGTCIQTITHPAISVWSVAVCAETGDIVSGASDNVVRVFTRREDRVANAETTRLFDEAVQSSAIPQQTLPEVNTQSLPGPEFLTNKSGTKDGQVQMIRQPNGSTTAHQWSTASNTWINVGVVVDAAGNGKKIDYLGKEYDYVFDVDMEDGKPPLKLPYNTSQNPYEAATKFIQDNEAPITYLDQVANFIIQNTQGATLGTSADTSGPDAWGSSDRYRPGDGDATGAALAPTPSPAAPKKIPQKEYLSILAVRVSGVQKKLTELNTELITAGHKDISLNPAELKTLHTLCAAIDPSGEKKLTSIPAGGLDLAVKLVTLWPYKSRLPALDVLRVIAVSPSAATFAHPRGGNLIDVLEAGATEETPAAVNHVMMAVRAFANLFASPEGRHLAVVSFEKINSIISQNVKNTKDRNLLVAASTVYINYAVLFTAGDVDVPDFEKVLAVIDNLSKIIAKQVDSEVVYRSLVALGTLLMADKEVTSMAKDVYRLEVVTKGAAAKATDPRIKGVVAEIRALL